VVAWAAVREKPLPILQNDFFRPTFMKTPYVRPKMNSRMQLLYRPWRVSMTALGLSAVLSAAGCQPLQEPTPLSRPVLAQAGYDVIAEYTGQYVCMQGLTALDLQIVKGDDIASPDVIFNFGPTESSPTVPTGSFLLHGAVALNGGTLSLSPVSWLSQPPGYEMVGLSGASTDGGATFEGSVLSGSGCTSFSVHRTFMAANIASAAPTPPTVEQPTGNEQLENDPSEIALKREGGILVVPVAINNAITLNFVIDSGAADVSIPADVVMTLIRTGTLNETDFIGHAIYQLADGSRVPSETFRIRVLKVGDREIENVTGSLARVEGNLLLGQSFLKRFKSWSIDNQRQLLLLD
jgi:gag-polyprotein putative aspartyl protease